MHTTLKITLRTDDGRSILLSENGTPETVLAYVARFGHTGVIEVTPTVGGQSFGPFPVAPVAIVIEDEMHADGSFSFDPRRCDA